MGKLEKSVFDLKYRFRKSRKEGLVTCLSCNNRTGGVDDKEPAFCEHEERLRKIKIAEYYPGFIGSGESHNIASKCVCDAYTSKSLPDGVEKIVLFPEKHAILLGTQYADPFHADPNCPYVTEELRAKKEGNKRAHFRIMDLSDMVPGETIRDICEMPCCESKLPFQISIPNDYRRKADIKPDGTEPIKWVRNGIVKHEKKVSMMPEEAKSIFDLGKFNSSEFGKIHEQISSANNYLGKHCNRLGSRPLSEATNPVRFSNRHHIFEKSEKNFREPLEIWVYDERLFDFKKRVRKPLRDLNEIPEGLILCLDTKNAFSSALAYCKNGFGNYWIYGIVEPVEDDLKLSKGINHVVDIGAVVYHDSDYWWGVFGKGFNKVASFHEQ